MRSIESRSVQSFYEHRAVSTISGVPNPGRFMTFQHISTIFKHLSWASSLVSLILISPALALALWQVSLLWLSAWGNWSSVAPGKHQWRDLGCWSFTILDKRPEMLGHFLEDSLSKLPLGVVNVQSWRSLVFEQKNNVRFQVERNSFFVFENLLGSNVFLWKWFMYQPTRNKKNGEDRALWESFQQQPEVEGHGYRIPWFFGPGFTLIFVRVTIISIKPIRIGWKCRRGNCKTKAGKLTYQKGRFLRMVTQ